MKKRDRNSCVVRWISGSARWCTTTAGQSG